MYQQVGNAENGVALVLADGYADLFAVSLYNNAVQRHGYGSPLVLLDTAVIVRLKERKLAVFVKRVLLEVQAGRVYVRRGKAYALCKRLFAHYSKYHRLFAVAEIKFIARFVVGSGVVLGKSCRFRALDSVCAGLALGLCGVEELLVVLAETVSRGYLFVAHDKSRIFRFFEQLSGKLFAGRSIRIFHC